MGFHVNEQRRRALANGGQQWMIKGNVDALTSGNAMLIKRIRELTTKK